MQTLIYKSNTPHPLPSQCRRDLAQSSTLARWASAYGLTIRGPYEAEKEKRVNPFPVNSVYALRGALFALQHSDEAFWHFSLLVFKSYWSEGRDISDRKVLTSIASLVGFDTTRFNTWVDSVEAKAAIRANTAECVELGGFGSPTFVVNNKHMYFGNDRLLLLSRRIALVLGNSAATRGCGHWVAKL